MKKELIHFKLLLITLSLITTFSCSKDDNATGEKEEQETTEPVSLNNEVNDFIWKGLNEIYLWQGSVSDLADERFTTQDDYYTFLNNYSDPSNLFDDLLYQINVVDKFSYLTENYRELEASLAGTSKSNGLDFGLVRLSNSNDVFGYIRYVANNSDASTKDIGRGEFFLTVDGTQITVDNYYNLLYGANDTYTLGMANITNGSIALNGKTVELTKTEFTENPILINKTLEVNGTKVGYLMYNQFINSFDNELNNVFANFLSEGVTELVLDLRYNPGGYTSSAIALSSMITGQFTDQVFYTEKWNSKYQSYYVENYPDYLNNYFTNTLADETAISSLNLNKVYVLTTGSSASSSELVINGLDPYIDVVQIGTNTYGKYVGSVTLYDSSNFSKENANPNHTYAMQPIVVKSANADGVSDYYNGLTPDYLITYETSSGATAEGENLMNLGILGDENEPFLEKALSIITNGTAKTSNSKPVKGVEIEFLSDSKDFTPFGKNMFIEFKPIPNN